MTPNPYTRFGGSRLSFLDDDYAGVPTDARGQPIQSYQPPAAATPGTTINSAPAASGGKPVWTPELQALQAAATPTYSRNPGGWGQPSGVTASGGDQSNYNSLQSMIKAAGGEAGIRAQMANWKDGRSATASRN